jgi:hypothetical protein
MASITITTTAEEDQAIKAATDLSNTQRAPLPAETAVQFFRRHVAHKIAAWVKEFKQSTELTRGELFKRASTADQASIDAILAQYQD